MYSLIIVTGQTATGKTKRALELAKQYNGELINCDSRQIYKKLDIITGKDKKTIETTKIPIRLYDIVDPKQYFSSYDYKNAALQIITELNKRGKVPIFVGGTYLYIKHLLYDVATETIPPNWELRRELENANISDLQSHLIKINKQIFHNLNNSDRNNPQRLIRKIEISLFKGKLQKVKSKTLFEQYKKTILFEGLKLQNKDDLKKRIADRVTQRLNDGAMDEVRMLLDQGYTADDPGLKTIGYQQIIKYLNGHYSKKKAIDEWITREVQYAKRQYTFMKTDPNIRWTLI